VFQGSDQREREREQRLGIRFVVLELIRIWILMDQVRPVLKYWKFSPYKAQRESAWIRFLGSNTSPIKIDGSDCL
jgi:hypothetical protein